MNLVDELNYLSTMAEDEGDQDEAARLQVAADYFSGPHVFSAVDLDRLDLPPLEWTVPGVIPEGLVLLAGPPKVGKSYFVMATALGIASGGVALGRIRVDRRPVFYMALEDGPRRLQQRARDLLAGQPVPDGLTFATRMEPAHLRPVVGGWLKQNPNGVVILDTLGRVRPPATSSNDQYGNDYRVMSALKELVDDRPGSTFVIVHHTRKQAATDVFDTVSGTTGLTGAVDTTLILSRPRGEQSGVLEVTGRDVPEGSYALVSKPGGSWELDGRDLDESASKAAQVKATAGVGDRMADVIAYVNGAGDTVRPADVAKALDLPNDQAGIYLRRAAESDRIRKAGRGSYVPVLSVLSVRNDENSVRNGQDEKNTPNTKNTPPLGDCQVCGERLDPIWAEAGAHPACLDGAA